MLLYVCVFLVGLPGNFFPVEVGLVSTSCMLLELIIS